jgi:hypothetical protein
MVGDYGRTAHGWSVALTVLVICAVANVYEAAHGIAALARVVIAYPTGPQPIEKSKRLKSLLQEGERRALEGSGRSFGRNTLHSP